jgi:DNA-binding NarL/FixJ family response regulator
MDLLLPKDNGPLNKNNRLIRQQPTKVCGKMIELGARGYLTKTSSLEEINHGIMEVHRGDLYICEEVRKNIPL